MEKKNPEECFEFREVRISDTEAVVEIEKICFPPNEACSETQMADRVRQIPELFLVAVDRENGTIAGFLNGLATDEDIFRDEFFMDADLHQPDGRNVMLLGLDVLPAYRGRGLASEIMRRYLERETERGRKAVYLTCHDHLVSMYQRFGYEDLGISGSVWGGETWHDMKYIC